MSSFLGFKLCIVNIFDTRLICLKRRITFFSETALDFTKTNIYLSHLATVLKRKYEHKWNKINLDRIWVYNQCFKRYLYLVKCLKNQVSKKMFTKLQKSPFYIHLSTSKPFFIGNTSYNAVQLIIGTNSVVSSSTLYRFESAGASALTWLVKSYVISLVARNPPEPLFPRWMIPAPLIRADPGNGVELNH